MYKETGIKSLDLYDKIERVIGGGDPFSEKVAMKDSSMVLVRLMPYMSGKKVKGAIVNFIELNEGVELK